MSYTCPFCGKTSHNPNDEAHRYCGFCHHFDDERPMQITAPFTADQVEALNRWQHRQDVHPFTCPGEHDVCKLDRNLFATAAGWSCQCGGYWQGWAHAFMAASDETEKGKAR